MIKVMSFNIRYGLADDGVNHWQYRKPLVLERIRTFEPDVLGLQECLDNEQAAFMRETLPDYAFYGVQRGGVGESTIEMAPLLFKKSAFDCLAQGCFWLSNTQDVAGSQDWDSDFPRTCTWAKLTHLATDRTLFYVNTHFDYQPLAMLASAKLLQQWLEENTDDAPLIVTGDFNSEKDSWGFQHLTETGLLFDAHQRQDCGGTFHDFGRLKNIETLDWILHSGHFRVLEAAVDTYHEDAVYPSDHYPINAVLAWNR